MHSGWAVRRTQFGVLYRVFLARVVDLELLSADADTTRLVGQFATIFASMSFLFSVPMLVAVPVVLFGGAEGLKTAIWTPEHFFIATTMVVSGVVAVLTWDSAFPDRRDALVLAPLPVRTSTVFFAKLAALLAAPILAVFALNVFSGVLWPVVFAAHGDGTLHALRAWPAYWITMSAAGAFIFCSLLTLQGVAANLLPRQLFLRLSALLQAAVLCTLLVVYFLEPSLEFPAALAAPQNQRLLAALPTYWFLGMFQQLNGSMHPAFSALAARAWIGLAASILGAAAVLLLSYVRMLPRAVEEPDIVPLQRRTRPSLLRNPIHAAIFSFTVRTLMRSRQQRMILSFYVGVGLAILVGYLRGPFGPGGRAQAGFGVVVLVASTLITILAVMALRVVATIPVSPRANWIFRITQMRPAKAYRGATRVTWLVLGAGAVLPGAACIWFALYPWRPVAGHLIVLFAVAMLVVEVCLYGFRKIPFACSYLPGKANIHIVFWGSLLLFIWLLNEAATVESRMLLHLDSAARMILLFTVIVAAARWLNETFADPAQELIFEEEYPLDIVTLKLN